MDLAAAIQSRGSVKAYDPDHVVSDDQLKQLFALVVRSPSSFNLQHWRFIAVRDAATRQALMAAAWGQSHVGQCSVDVVVCGKLLAHEDAPEIFADAPAEMASRMLPMIQGFYAGKPQLQRDEALRSGSLAAMTLMLAAQDLGLATCPMIGFDPVKVAAILGIPDDHVPVMIVTLGKATRPARPTGRLPLQRVVKLGRFDGPGLE